MWTGKIQISKHKYPNTEGFTVITDVSKNPGCFFYEEIMNAERAARLVKCWNSHDAMAEALEHGLSFIKEVLWSERRNHGSNCAADLELRDELQAALAAAKGEG